MLTDAMVRLNLQIVARSMLLCHMPLGLIIIMRRLIRCVARKCDNHAHVRAEHGWCEGQPNQTWLQMKAV